MESTAANQRVALLILGPIAVIIGAVIAYSSSPDVDAFTGETSNAGYTWGMLLVWVGSMVTLLGIIASGVVMGMAEHHDKACHGETADGSQT